MFTGLVASKGTIHSIKSLDDGVEVVFCLEHLFNNTTIGDSVSVNGICSTIIALSDREFKVHYLRESIDKTTIKYWKVGDGVSFELCVTPSSRLGGHFVSGHVDGVGELVRFEQQGKCWELDVRFGSEFLPYIIPKGSVALDGISLTVGADITDVFTCYLIPHTVETTVLSSRCVGDFMNMEFDMVGKYLYRFYQLSRE